MIDYKEEYFKFPSQFQKDILGCLVTDRKFLRQSYGTLKPEYFEKEIYTLACKGIFELYKQTKGLPTKSNLLHILSESLRKKYKAKDKEQERIQIIRPVSKLLKQMFSVNGSQEYVKKETIKFCQVQDLKRTCLQAFEILEDKGDPENAKSFISKQIRSSGSLEYGGRNFSKVIDKLPSQLYRDKSKCLTTGFPSLDKWMFGGMDPQTETVFIAPAKYGKSMILVNLGYANLCKNKTVVHFTLEISEKKILARYASRISGISMNRFESKAESVVRRSKKFLMGHKGSLYVKEYPTRSASVETLKSYLYHLVNRGVKPDLVIVDYGELLRSSNYTQKGEGLERFIQGDIFEALRAMAQEFDCCVVTASQCNRAAASKPVIIMEDIGESYQKVQTADHIVALCGTREERRNGYMRLFYAGSREGATGRTCWMKFKFRKAYMMECEKPMDVEED